MIMKSFLNQIIIAIDGGIQKKTNFKQVYSMFYLFMFFVSSSISNKCIQCFIYLWFLFQVEGKFSENVKKTDRTKIKLQL